jgi:hypothetical protein
MRASLVTGERIVRVGNAIASQRVVRVMGVMSVGSRHAGTGPNGSAGAGTSSTIATVLLLAVVEITIPLQERINNCFRKTRGERLRYDQ